jgi:hypothetical protein
MEGEIRGLASHFGNDCESLSVAKVAIFRCCKGHFEAEIGSIFDLSSPQFDLVFYLSTAEKCPVIRD